MIRSIFDLYYLYSYYDQTYTYEHLSNKDTKFLTLSFEITVCGLKPVLYLSNAEYFQSKTFSELTVEILPTNNKNIKKVNSLYNRLLNIE